MATNSYFRNFGAKNDQELLHSIVTESIKVTGYDVNYIPRTLVNEDTISFENRWGKNLKISSISKNPLEKCQTQIPSKIPKNSKFRISGEEFSEISENAEIFENSEISKNLGK